ncbi:tRNA nucleotidyltransferase cca2 isoform X2 [Silene latifolia]|uniref:tRNA nucleotidyltransferase cca2 isoform X2 n=1 Tax=Silene latifolia TaxID=37657 RepID=UPI003D778D6A
MRGTMRIALSIHRLIINPKPSIFSPFNLHPLTLKKSPISRVNPTKTLINFSSFHCKSTTMETPEPLIIQVNEQIELTEKESLIFNRLKDVLRGSNLDTQLRVAGGWVRDKLLGKDCNDIDIAIDNMLGKELCEIIKEYLSKTGEEVKVGVIQSNPDQSKHLETATMRLFDQWIDFVNLRAEDYCEDSRIPTMRFGTPKEDAYRRDLTINSMFYNINTGSVEDFTGRGITDLKLGKIVTPLPPKETFLDDPLRVLRSIRFGARFNFTLDEDLKKAAASDEVREAIAKKISRERIGHEVDLMIAGNQPVKAVTYICDLQLFWTVFTLPSNVDPSTPEACDRSCLMFIDAAWSLVQSLESLTLSDDQRRLCLYSAMFLPLRSMTYKDKKKPVPVVDHIFLNSLKLKVKDSKTVTSVHHAAEKFISIISLFTSQKDMQHAKATLEEILIDVPEASKLRIWTGLLLREIKEFWPVALLMSTLVYPYGDLQESSTEGINLEKCRELFNLVNDSITEQGLENIWETKPLINGTEIMSILNIKGGPGVKEWQQKVMQWQLSYPTGTADKCEEWLREMSVKRARMD